MSIKMTQSNTLTLVASVLEIENAIQRLSRNDLASLRNWFIDFDTAAWDKQNVASADWYSLSRCRSRI